MTDYRIVSRHVRYWRGSVHRWSTVWRFTGTITSANYASATAAIKTLEMGVNYPGISAKQGGIYEIAIYDHATGGVPVQTTTYFDWTNPTVWVDYTGVGWASPHGVAVGNAETAILVEWAGGLSSSGKPVKFRKWFHMTPVTVATSGAADISPTDQSGLAAIINTQVAVVGGLGAPMGNGGRLAATTAVVNPHYGNHQMPRGRRRPALVSASGKYRGPSIVVPELN